MLDVNCDGTKFVTGGEDKQIRVYDVGKKSKPKIFEGVTEIPNHSNRIHAVKFLNDRPNIFLTAGWDNTVVMWDIRTSSNI